MQKLKHREDAVRKLLTDHSIMKMITRKSGNGGVSALCSQSKWKV